MAHWFARQLLMLQYHKAPVLGLFLWLWGSLSWSATTPPQRIVVLAPHAGELVCAAGACERIVGVVSYTDFPHQLNRLPKVGDYTRINYEALLKLKPDLIIAWQGGTPQPTLQQLKKMGFRLFLSNPEKLEDIPAEIQQLGHILDTQPHADKVATILKRQLDALKTRFYADQKVSVFYQLWFPPLMTIGARQFITQAIALCGGQNIFADIQHPAPTVNIEAVIARNPEVILLGGEKKRHPDWRRFWKKKWPMIKAVYNNRIYAVEGDLLQRPGPRLIAGAAQLCWQLKQHR